MIVDACIKLHSASEMYLLLTAGARPSVGTVMAIVSISYTFGTGNLMINVNLSWVNVKKKRKAPWLVNIEYHAEQSVRALLYHKI